MTEYLMAEALEGGHDCVVTIGGVQSNHCRATAAAARLVGMDPHLVLLVRDAHADDDPGLQARPAAMLETHAASDALHQTKSAAPCRGIYSSTAFWAPNSTCVGPATMCATVHRKRTLSVYQPSV